MATDCALARAGWPGLRDLPPELLCRLAADGLPVWRALRGMCKDAHDEVTAATTHARLRFPWADAPRVRRLVHRFGTVLECLEIHNADLQEMTVQPPNNLSSLTGLRELRLRGVVMTSLAPLRPLTRLARLELTYIEATSLGELTLLPLEELTAEYCRKVVSCAGLPATLRKLRLGCCCKLPSLDTLSALTDLQDLELTNARLTKCMEPLGGLSRLERLRLGGADGEDLTAQPLAGLTRLRELSLWGMDIRSLQPLAGLTALERLDISCNSDIPDIAELGALTGLQELDLSGLVDIEDVAPLRGLTRLRKLSISECYRVEDFSPLTALTGLEDLDLSVCAIDGENFDKLRVLASLTKLDISRALRSLDLELLRPLAGLRALAVGGNSVADIAPLGALTGLAELRIRNCPCLTDIAPLGRLTGLEVLEITMCKDVQDLAPLGALEGLRTLVLGSSIHTRLSGVKLGASVRLMVWNDCVSED